MFQVNDESLLHPKLVCSRLGISRRTLRRLVRSGALGAFTVGASLRFAEADLQSYLSANRIDPRPRAFLSKRQ